MSEFTSPAVQTMNLIRYIGDQVSESGKPIPYLDGVSEEIGAPSEDLAKQLIKELHEHDLIIMGEPSKELIGPRLPNVNLTLAGWKQYEAEKRGEFEGNYGFIAMQFNDPDLDSFVRDVVKPAVKKDVG